MNARDPVSIRIHERPVVARALRIAVVSETYPPEVNGVALTIAKVAEGLHGRGHDLRIVRPRQGRGDVARSGPRWHEVLMRGMPIPRYPHLRMGLPAKRALLQRWSHERPDVVHIATEGPLGHSAMRAAVQLGLPVTSDFRTNFHAYSRHYGIGWLHAPIMGYLKRFHNATHATMCPTAQLRDELETTGFRNVSVVSRGIDSALFSPAHRDGDLRRSWGLADDDLVVIHVGRLALEKNLSTVLRAFDAIRAGDPRARLLLVGDGPLRQQLQRDRPDAIFAGQRGGKDLARHYASADLFLFPSLTETFGNVTIEAMASGLSVVAYDYAAAAELIVAGRNGALVAKGDEDAFVAAARAVASDRSWRVAMGAGARERACREDWDAVFGRVEAILVQAVEANTHGAALRLFEPSIV